MEVFDVLVNSMQIKDTDKKIILSAKKNIEERVLEKDFVGASRTCEDLIQAIKNLNSEPKKSFLLRSIVDKSYEIRSKYIRTYDIGLGTYINAEVETFGKSRQIHGKLIQGDPMFFLQDDYGRRYDCFIKEAKNLKFKDKEKLWITNINWGQRMIYLEPRVENQDIIYAKIKDISRRDEPIFRFLSYDGFVKIFDNVGLTRLNIGECYKMESVYTRLGTSINRQDRKIYRLGILFSHALQKVSEDIYRQKEREITRAG
ncbi:MAG: hypothetical protein ACP5OG_00405 [Candidatus Nanoarchaeia archaeon]